VRDAHQADEVWAVAADGSDAPSLLAAAQDGRCIANEGWTPAGEPLVSRCSAGSAYPDTTWRLTVSGPVVLVAGADIAYSPDGKRLAFVRSDNGQQGGRSVLVASDANGANARDVAQGGVKPVWSSTGLLAYQLGGEDWQLVVTDVATGRTTSLGVGLLGDFSADGAWLVFTSKDGVVRVRPDGSGRTGLGTGVASDVLS
jgi:hypothetical protein